MTEKLIFQMSGLIKDSTDIEEIEFWGHDAGEYIKAIQELLDGSETMVSYPASSQSTDIDRQ